MSVGHILFGFEGRLNRARWWGFSLLALVALVVVLVVMQVLGALLAPTRTGIAVFTLIGYLPFIWIYAALGVKRLHDRNRSGALLLVFFLGPLLLSLLALTIQSGLDGLLATLALGRAPTTGTVSAVSSQAFVILLLQLANLALSIWALIELGCLDGTPGWNRYGPDPTAKSYAAHG